MKNAADKSIRVHFDISQFLPPFQEHWVVTKLSQNVGITLQKTVKQMCRRVFIYYTRHNTERMFCTQTIHVTCCIHGCDASLSEQKRLTYTNHSQFLIINQEPGLGRVIERPRIITDKTIWKMPQTEVYVYILIYHNFYRLLKTTEMNCDQAISKRRHHFAKDCEADVLTSVYLLYTSQHWADIMNTNHPRDLLYSRLRRFIIWTKKTNLHKSFTISYYKPRTRSGSRYRKATDHNRQDDMKNAADRSIRVHFDISQFLPPFEDNWDELWPSYLKTPASLCKRLWSRCAHECLFTIHVTTLSGYYEHKPSTWLVVFTAATLHYLNKKD